MADHAALLGASTAQSTLLVLFIPSRDRFDQPIDQDHWVGQALEMLGTHFNGATAFPQGRGVCATTRRAANCFTTNRSSFIVTPASKRWSSKPGLCVRSSIASERKAVRGPLASSSTGTTWRSPSRWPRSGSKRYG